MLSYYGIKKSSKTERPNVLNMLKMGLFYYRCCLVHGLCMASHEWQYNGRPASYEVFVVHIIIARSKL